MTMKVNRPKTSKLNNLVGGHTLTRLCAETMWTEFSLFGVRTCVCGGEAEPEKNRMNREEKKLTRCPVCE